MNHLLDEIMQLTSQSLQGAEDILKITEEMKEHIQEQDVKSLNDAIDMRQEIMDEQSSINKTVKEKVEGLLNRYSVTSIEEIDQETHPQIENIIDGKRKAKLIYGRICDMEKSNCKGVEGLLTEYRDAIKGLHTNKKALRAYGNKPPKQSILIDKVK